nr:hypothetical protein BaRGS_024422 [Batillaria attramentaria]
MWVGVSTGWIVGVVISIIAIIFGLVCLIIGICHCYNVLKGRQFSLCPTRSGAKKYTEPQTELHLHDGMAISHPSAIDTTPNTARRVIVDTPPRPFEQAGQFQFLDDGNVQSYDSPSFDDDVTQLPYPPEMYRDSSAQSGEHFRHAHAQSVSSGVRDGSPPHDSEHDVTSDDVIGGRPPYSLRTTRGSVSECEDVRQSEAGAPGDRGSWTLFASECFERDDPLPTSLKPDGLYSIGEGVSLDAE